MTNSGKKETGKRYCFTIDDNIRFFEEIQKNGLKSVFDHPYLAMLRRIHRQYGTRVHLNVFYSYRPGGFSLSDFPQDYREEWRQNADWLRFSFHAKHNELAFPYDSTSPETLVADYRLVTDELMRIAGRESVENTVTLHYMRADKECCQALREQGVQALIGSFYPISGREALNYYFSWEQTMQMKDHSFCREGGILFAKNDVILNQLALKDILPCLAARKNQTFIQIMIHEQYFYEDYGQYQPDFEEKLITAIGWLTKQGYEPEFLSEEL